MKSRSLEEELEELRPNERRVYDAFTADPKAKHADVAAALVLSEGTVKVYRGALRSKGLLPQSSRRVSPVSALKYLGVADDLREGYSVREIMKKYQIQQSYIVFAVAEREGIPLEYIGNRIRITEYFQNLERKAE